MKDLRHTEIGESTICDPAKYKPEPPTQLDLVRRAWVEGYRCIRRRRSQQTAYGPWTRCETVDEMLALAREWMAQDMIIDLAKERR